MAILGDGTVSLDLETKSIVVRDSNGGIVVTHSIDTLSGYSVTSLEGEPYINNQRSYTDAAGVVWTQTQTGKIGDSTTGYQNIEVTTNSLGYQKTEITKYGIDDSKTDEAIVSTTGENYTIVYTYTETTRISYTSGIKQTDDYLATIDLTSSISLNGDFISFNGTWENAMPVDTVVKGTKGNDTLTVYSNTDSVQADAGMDTVVFSGNYADYTFSQSDSYVPLITHNTAYQVVSLFGVEQLQFDDALIDVISSNNNSLKVNSDAPANYRTDPSITSSSDGGYVVAWESYGQVDSESRDDIYAMRYDENGAAISEEFLVNSHTIDYQQKPNTTSLTNDSFVIVWQSNGQGDGSASIVGQLFNNNGNTINQEFVIELQNYNHSTTQQDPVVTSLDGGDFLIAWQGGGYGSLIEAQRFDSIGNLIGSEFKLNTYQGSFQNYVSMSALDNGGFVAAWETTNNTDGIYQSDIYAQIFDASSNKVGVEFKVNTYTELDQTKPKVAELANGGFVIVWESEGQDGPSLDQYGNDLSTGVYAKIYDNTGNVVVPEFIVNTTTDNDQEDVAVTGLSDGSFVVIWESYGQDKSQDFYANLIGQRFDSLGNKLGGEFQIDSNAYNSSSRNGDVASTSDGGFTITWQTSYQIFTQRYDADGGALGIVAFNAIPEITSTAITTVNEDNEYSYQFTVDDLDALDVVSLSADSIPSWLIFDASTGILSGTPTNDDVGIHSIILNSAIVQRVTDDVNLAQEFTIAVANTNDAPTVSTVITDTSTNEDAVYSYDVSANFTDVDSGDTATYTATLADDSALPSWLSITSAGVLSGTPLNANVGAIDVKVTHADAASESVSDAYTLTVANTNDAPVAATSPQITMNTSLGTIVFELNAELAPITVENILNYVNSGFYDDTLFHRVIPGFMVQGGGFTTGMVNSPTNDPIVLESDNGLSNLRGTIAMARTSVPDSATSQFFINLVDNSFLDYQSVSNPGYAVFGEVISGLSVIDSIAQVYTTTVGGYQNVPLADVVITSFQQTALGQINDTSTNEDVAYSYDASAHFSDVDAGDTATYTVSGNPSWLSIDSDTGALSGTPTNDDVATTNVTVARTDTAGLSASDTFTLAVDNINDAPTVSTTIADASTNEDAAYSYNASAHFTDVDAGDTLAYSAVIDNGDSTVSDLPSWLSINPTTGILSGTPDNSDVGSLNIQVTAVDQGGLNIISEVATYFINNIVSVNDLSVNTYTSDDTPLDILKIKSDSSSLVMKFIFKADTSESVGLTGITSLSDLSGLSLSVIESKLSAWHQANYTSTEIKTLFTNEILNAIDLTVDQYSSVDYPLEVIEFNSSSFTSSVKLIYENTSDLYSRDDGQLYSWSEFGDLRDLSGIDKNDLKTKFNSMYEDSGYSDRTGESVSDTYTLAVDNINDAPTVSTTIADASTNEDAAYSYNASANFTDVDAGDTLAYSAVIDNGDSTVSDLPSWLSINPTTGILSGTPDNSDVGSLNIQVTAVDQGGLNIISEVATYFINNIVSVNDLSVNTYTSDDTPLDILKIKSDSSSLVMKFIFKADTSESVGLTGITSLSDLSGLSLSVIESKLSAWHQANYTSTEIKTLFTNEILNAIDLTVDQYSSVDYPLEVIEFNSSSFTSSVKLIYENTSDLYSRDDGQLYSWSEFGDLRDLSGIDKNDLKTKFNSMYEDSGYSDRTGESVSDTYTLAVDNINDAPTVSTTIADASTNEDAAYSYNASAHFTDVDVGDTATYTVSGNLAWMTIDSATGTLSGTPDNDDIAVTNITVTRTDTAGLSASDTFALTVDNINDTPILTSDLPISEVNEDSVFTYDLSSHFTDVDKTDVLSYSITNGYYYQMTNGSNGSGGSYYPESWLEIDSQTGILTARPTGDNTGIYKIGVNVSDGNESLEDYLYLKVNEVNDKPTLLGDLFGSVVIGSDNDTNGVITGSDPDGLMSNFQQLFTMNYREEWSTYSESINSDGKHVVKVENLWGDHFSFITDESWLESGDTPYHSQPDNYYLITSDQDWLSLSTVENNGITTVTILDSIGNDIVATKYADNSYSIILSGAMDSSIWLKDVDLHIYQNSDGNLRTVSGSITINKIESVIVVDLAETLDDSGDRTSVTGVVTIDDIPTDNLESLYDDGFDNVFTTTTNYGINSVLDSENNLLYQIQHQQGIYGSLKLDKQTNWTYTLDESDPDTIALTLGTSAIDSFNITLFDGYDTTIQAISIDVVNPINIDTILSSKEVQGSELIDSITTIGGSNTISASAGNDIINLASNSVWGAAYSAQNINNTNSVSTNQKINLDGFNRFSDVIDGGADVDTLNLTTGNDAFFIDDIYSDHHSSLTLTSTTQGIDSTARITNLEVINAGDGNDIVDLTSTNYILANAVVINGEAGNDNLWGSNGNDTIDGGTGDDSIFGGTGSDTLTGGTGNDVFQFTATAGSDVISDFGVGSDSISLYHRVTDKHTNADLDLTNGILTWDVDTTNNDVVIDLSATTTSSDLNSLDALITFVEIV